MELKTPIGTIFKLRCSHGEIFIRELNKSIGNLVKYVMAAMSKI